LIDADHLEKVPRGAEGQSIEIVDPSFNCQNWDSVSNKIYIIIKLFKIKESKSEALYQEQ